MQPGTGSPFPSSVLIVDTQTELADALAEKLSAQVVRATSGSAARQALKAQGFDLVIAALDAADAAGGGAEQAVFRLAQAAEGAVIIALSDEISVSATMAAMRGGAHDCLIRPVDAEALLGAVEVLARRHGRKNRQPAREPAGETHSFGGFVGVSAEAELLRRQIARLGGSDAPVFISGERGVGKSHCAELMHRGGPRAGKPLLSLDCRRETAAGLGLQAEAAAGGTLVVDHVEALDASGQKVLMRLLDEGAGRPNVRLVCTTRATTAELTAQRTLREDLYFRLNVLAVHIPPLRQRGGDIAAMASHFGQVAAAELGLAFQGFTSAAEDDLGGRDWRGNAAELREAVRHAVGRRLNGRIDVDQLGSQRTVVAPVAAGEPILPLWQQERRAIEAALIRFEGNIAQAAAALEISPSTIYRKMQGWDAREGDLAGAA